MCRYSSTCWLLCSVELPLSVGSAGGAFPSTDLSPEQQWDARPLGAKWKIFALISVLEVWVECVGGVMPHYMSGCQPGKYPSFKSYADQVHTVLNLYDPFVFFKKMSGEK